MRLSIVLILYSLTHVQSAWGSDITLHVGTHKIHATLANTPGSRERGLMQSTHLCENCGMLFVFPRPEKHGFWMKNTPLPLSIAFISPDGHILNIEEMQANSANIHLAKGEALYALEMNRGWFTEKGIKTHALVQGLQQLPPGQ